MNVHRDVTADLVLSNANVITIDETQPRAEAVAIRGDRILAVGTTAAVDALVDRGTRVLDLAGKTVIPGFNDAHDHMAGYGLELNMVSLHPRNANGIGDIVRALRERAATTERGTWILGAGYDDNKLAEGRHPTREELDRASRRHPIYVRHTSGHMCVVNTKALQEIGIDRDTPDPTGGHIVRDDDGVPTGLLQETAMKLVTETFFPYAVPTLVDALAAANDVYVSEGITSHTEAGIGYLSDIELLAYRQAVDEGRLKVRSNLMVRAEALLDLRGAEDERFLGLSQGIRTGWGDERLRIGPIKMFSDGSLIGRTAAMREGFATEPDNTGFFATPEHTLRDWIQRGHASGWQIAIHAIGDRAVSFILDCYEEALSQHPRADHRHRIEHCGVIDADMLQRIADLGVIPVPQQRFIGELGDGFKRSLGTERSRWCYVQKSFLDAGIPMPGSSDRYVVEGAPLLGIHDAVNQKTASGADYVPEEAITPEDAIRAYTLHSAYASFEEDRKGSVTAGKLADLTILGADPTRVPSAEIRDIPVLGTIIGGEVVFERGL